MSTSSEAVVAEGPLNTLGGVLGIKDVPCHVVVTRTHLAVRTRSGTETLRFEDVTGTKRVEFRLKPWGPTIVQLAVEKATSNQFGANQILLKTTHQDRAEGLAVLDAIERLARERHTDAGRPVDSDPTDVVRRLAALRDEGILTEEEFVAKKRALLGLE